MAEPLPAGDWSLYDALILSAITHARRGTSLDEVMARSDAIDKSYPTRDQLASALGALAAAGLIEKSERGFRTTKAGKALVKMPGLFARHRDLLPYLETVPRKAEAWPLTDAEVAAAIATYLGRSSHRH